MYSFARFSLSAVPVTLLHHGLIHVLFPITPGWHGSGTTPLRLKSPINFYFVVFRVGFSPITVSPAPVSHPIIRLAEERGFTILTRLLVRH
jgi:hypothetical protein